MKIGRGDGDPEEPLIHGKKWMVRHYPNIDAVQVAVDKNQIDLMVQFANRLSPPYYVLYVLLVSRCGNDVGRYESEPFHTWDELAKFMRTYQEFFEDDGRHNLWVGEIEGPGLLVYDRHNRIFAYGEVAQYTKILEEEGYVEADFGISSPHTHHYNKEFDGKEKGIVAEKIWRRRLPLQDGDDE